MNYCDFRKDDTSLKQELFTTTKLFDKKIWTATETAAFLNRSVGTIYNLVYLGKLPFYKRGKRLYFIPQEILNWVQEGD